MRALALAIVLGGCGGDAARVDAGPLPTGAVGLIRLVEAGASGSLAGVGAYAEMRDRPDPVAASLRVREGDCAVYAAPTPSFCEPACDATSQCVEERCVPYPARIDVGTIVVTGLSQGLSFEPGGFGYTPTPAPPADLFTDAAAITASSSELDVAATGVASLAAPFQNVTLVDGADARFTWTAGPAGPAQIQLRLVVGWHVAAPEAYLECETADDGELVIPGALVAALPRASSGLEQHPSTLTRFTRGTGPLREGEVTLFVGSQEIVYFSHP